MRSNSILTQVLLKRTDSMCESPTSLPSNQRAFSSTWVVSRLPMNRNPHKGESPAGVAAPIWSKIKIRDFKRKEPVEFRQGNRSRWIERLLVCVRNPVNLRESFPRETYRFHIDVLDWSS